MTAKSMILDLVYQDGVADPYSSLECGASGGSHIIGKALEHCWIPEMLKTGVDANNQPH